MACKLGGILHLYTALGTKVLSLRSRIMKPAAPDVWLIPFPFLFPFAFLTGAVLFDAAGWFRDLPS